MCGDGRGVVIRYVNVKAGEPEPELPPELCEACGRPKRRMLWIIVEPDEPTPQLPPGHPAVVHHRPYTPPEGPLTPETARLLLRDAGL